MVAVPKKKFKKKAKKPKPISAKQWIKLLDELWRCCIHIRDRSTCQYTLLLTGKKTLGADSHHIFSRNCKHTRWVVKNGILLRPYHSTSDAHVRPEKFRRTLIDKGWITQEEYDNLYRLSEKIDKFTTDDYATTKTELLWSLGLLLRVNPDYMPLIKDRMEGWLKCWPITPEERESIFS